MLLVKKAGFDPMEMTPWATLFVARWLREEEIKAMVRMAHATTVAQADEQSANKWFEANT